MRDDGKIHEIQQSKSMVGPIIALLLVVVGISYMLPGSKLPYLIGGNTSQLASSSSNVRIDQTDRSQYDSQSEFDTWHGSSCSSASMTYVLNSLGGHYILHDVLSAEIQQGEISSYSGLLNGYDGIAKTVQSLGFHASPVVGGLDGIVGMANGGNPVLVSMQNSDWPSGHVLVVIGGDNTNIRVVDSWTTNKTFISRVDFSQHWTGLAATVSKGA